ncbi:MAG: hypothetical protein JAY96_13485 [Candidatus Thiodiazotropha endolucinida]|nr:hypothetical protein [Candidatus Thiodiazotropha taylori]MCW4249201.1 hypothetical protein [Candidatus Thiodiazotropha endolucinida]
MTDQHDHKHCDGCHRPIKKAHAKHGGKSFCGTCYKREFKRVECAECGKGTYAYHGKEPAYCKTCRNKGRTCAGCDKPLPRASKIIDGEAFCWPCAAKRQEPEPCALCGQLSLRLSRAPEIGIDERICWKCRTKKTHFTCTSCGKYRKPAGIDSQGRVVCKSCLTEEEYRCPRCGEPGKPHSKTRCQACYWSDHAQEAIAQGVAALSRPWTRHAYRAFGESLITAYGSQKASHTIPKYLPFFISLDMRYQKSQAITPRGLIKTFGAEGLRRNNRATTFLAREGIIPAFCDIELQHYNEIAKQERLVEEATDTWYGSFLARFHDHCLRLQQTSLDRGNKSPKSKTVYSWISAARAFLAYVDQKGIKALSQIETHHYDQFLIDFGGYEASVRRFIKYLNKEGKLFKKVKMESIIIKNIAHLLLPQKRFDELTDKCFDPGTPAKEALIGVLMLYYAQTASNIARLRLDQLGRNEKGLRTIRFYRVDVEIIPEFEPIFDRWLKERKSLSALTSKHDNKFLFPGRRFGCHTSPASIKYYYDQWKVTADQLLASSLFQMYCNGVRHPNAPHNAFGLSKAMTGKYMDIFDAHYHDALDHFREQEKKKKAKVGK